MDFVRQTILRTFPKILQFADDHRTCKRKSVGCAILRYPMEHCISTPVVVSNGPSVPGNECTNIVGNCGCSHSEPRAILQLLKKNIDKAPTMLVCTYSPCTTCANVIIDSGVIQAVAYDILTEHDKRGDEFLRKVMPVFTRAELESPDCNATLRQWIIHCRDAQ